MESPADVRVATPFIKVYIVEDHPVMQIVLHDLLEDMRQLRVCGAAHAGMEALADPAVTDVDVVICDFALGDMRGSDVIAELRARRPDLPCLVLSGHITPGCVRESLSAGAQAFVAKEDVHELEDAIRQVLAGDRYLSRSIRVV